MVWIVITAHLISSMPSYISQEETRAQLSTLNPGIIKLKTCVSNSFFQIYASNWSWSFWYWYLILLFDATWGDTYFSFRHKYTVYKMLPFYPCRAIHTSVRRRSSSTRILIIYTMIFAGICAVVLLASAQVTFTCAWLARTYTCCKQQREQVGRCCKFSWCPKF